MSGDEWAQRNMLTSRCSLSHDRLITTDKSFIGMQLKSYAQIEFIQTEYIH